MSTARKAFLAIVAALAPSAAVLAAPQYSYDEQGRVIRIVGDDGSIVIYSYDRAGKRSRSSIAPRETLEFDAQGRAPSRAAQTEPQR